MWSVRIIPAPDGSEDGSPRLDVRVEGEAIEEMALERGEEALAECVVVCEFPIEPRDGRTPRTAQRSPRSRDVATIGRIDQYISKLFQRLLTELGVTCSTSRSCNVWDHLAMESFFRVAQDRTGQPPVVRLARPGAAGQLRQAGTLLRPAAPALHARLRESGAVRTPDGGSARQPSSRVYETGVQLVAVC